MHERLDRRRLLRGTQPAASINHLSTSCPSAATAAAQSESSESSAITVSIPWTANAPNQERIDSSWLSCEEALRIRLAARIALRTRRMRSIFVESFM
jgi:hypothetical protein